MSKRIQDMDPLLATDIVDADEFEVRDISDVASNQNKRMSHLELKKSVADFGIVSFTCGLNSAFATTLYLESNTVATNVTPLILPWDCTLVAITAASSPGTWDAEVHQDFSLVPGAFVSVAGASNFVNNLSIDFSAGDAIQMFCNGFGIALPSMSAFFKRRA
jgi:hypothetical protein